MDGADKLRRGALGSATGSLADGRFVTLDSRPWRKSEQSLEVAVDVARM